MTGLHDLKGMWRYTTVGVEFIAAFGIGFGIGLYLDRKVDGPAPWPLIGAGVGFAAGIYRIVRVARDYRRQFGGRKDRP